MRAASKGMSIGSVAPIGGALMALLIGDGRYASCVKLIRSAFVTQSQLK